MFAIRIEVWPFGNHTQPSHQVMIVGANDGTESSRAFGNYRAIIVPERLHDDPAEARLMLLGAMNDDTAATVTHFPRGLDQQHLPALTCAIIEALGLGEVAVR